MAPRAESEESIACFTCYETGIYQCLHMKDLAISKRNIYMVSISSQVPYKLFDIIKTTCNWISFRRSAVGMAVMNGMWEEQLKKDSFSCIPFMKTERHDVKSMDSICELCNRVRSGLIFTKMWCWITVHWFLDSLYSTCGYKHVSLFWTLTLKCMFFMKEAQYPSWH